MRSGFIDFLRPRILPALASGLLLGFGLMAQPGSAAPLMQPTTAAQPCNLGPAATPTQAPVARYLFNGTARDSSGSHHGVTHHVTLTSNRFGTGSSAYSFNGTNAYIEIPDADAFSLPTTGQLSISAWMRPGTLSFPDTE